MRKQLKPQYGCEIECYIKGITSEINRIEGDMAIGVYIYLHTKDNGIYKSIELHTISEYFYPNESHSENKAQFEALIACLAWLNENGYTDKRIKIITDLKLLIDIMTGIFEIGMGRYVNSAKEAFEILPYFTNLKFCWVSSKYNEFAYNLAKKARIKAINNSIIDSI